MGYFYNDPSGFASFWVYDGETVEQARKRHAQIAAEAGSDPAAIENPIAALPPDDFARVFNPVTQGTSDPSQWSQHLTRLLGGGTQSAVLASAGPNSPNVLPTQEEVNRYLRENADVIAGRVPGNTPPTVPLGAAVQPPPPPPASLPPPAAPPQPPVQVVRPTVTTHDDPSIGQQLTRKLAQPSGQQDIPFSEYYNGQQYSFVLRNPQTGESRSFGSALPPSHILNNWADYKGWSLDPPRPGLDGPSRANVPPPAVARPAVLRPEVSIGGGHGSLLAPRTQATLDPTQVSNTGANPPSAGVVNVRIGDQSRSFRINDPALDAALQQGGQIIGPNNSILPVQQFNGGWIVNTPNGPMTLNLFTGGAALPGELEALQAGISSGQLRAPQQAQAPPTQPPAVLRPTVTTADDPAVGDALTKALSKPKSDKVVIPPDPETGGFRLPLRGPNGDWKYSRDVGEIDSLIKQGYVVYRRGGSGDGTPANVETNWNNTGGTLIDGLPLNTVLTGTITDDQRRALLASGKQVPSDIAVVPTVSTGTPPAGPGAPTSGTGAEPGGGGNLLDILLQGGWFGNPGAAAPGLNDNLEKALFQLIQEARDQGKRGQESLTGLTSDLKDYLAFGMAGAQDSYSRGNELADMLLGKIMPGVESAIGTMNQATGLSPEGMAALRLQATEGPERAYQEQVQQLKTELGRRGALGGQMPGDANAILGGYAPLMTARDSTRSNLLSQAILADEQRKFDTLGLNRQTAASFANLAGGLAPAMKQAFSPSPFLGASEAGLGGLFNTINAGTASGFEGLNTASRLAGTLGEMQPASFKNTLLSALMGTGLSTLTSYLDSVLNKPKGPTTLEQVQQGNVPNIPLQKVGININWPDINIGGRREPGFSWGGPTIGGNQLVRK